MLFIRFIARKRDRIRGRTPSPIPARELGLFAAAYALENSARLAGADAAALRSTLDWFERNLRPTGTVTIARRRWTRTPVAFWFTPNAVEHVAHARTIAVLLRRNGYDVRVLRSAHPGLILYRDEHQVLAVPFRDGEVAESEI
jgi:hypothetical protein